MRQEGEQEGERDLCEKAVELAKRALHEDPKLGFVYRDCMLSLFSLIPGGVFYDKIKPQLLSDIEEALQLAPNNADMLALLAVELRDRDPKRSHHLLTQAVKLDSNNLFVLTSLAECLYVGATRDPAQAREVLERALAIDPEHPLACLLLGEVLHHFNDVNRSTALIEKALLDRPKLKQQLKEALSGNHTHLIALMYLSRILQQGIGDVQKDLEEAIKLRRTAKHLDPDNTLKLLRIFSDCDIDALVAKADHFGQYQRIESF